MDSPDRRLRKARLDAGFKTAAAAFRRFGWREAAYRHHENGTRDFDPEKAQEYAKAFNVRASWLLCLPEPNQDVGEIDVIGEAAIGVWLERAVERMPQSSEKKIVIPVTSAKRKGGKRKFGVRVADASVDRIFPVGWYVICVEIRPGDHLLDQFTVGDVLYIERSRRGLKEMSLRRVSAIEDDKMRLSTHSSDVALKQEITYPPSNGSIERIALLGKVVGRYGDFPD